MKSIYKYDPGLPADGILELRGEILHVGVQSGNVTLWAMYDDSKPVTRWRIDIVGTGFSVGDEVGKFNHIGTVFSGPFVWHVFATELKN